jgi:hypothetical protein
MDVRKMYLMCDRFCGYLTVNDGCAKVKSGLKLWVVRSKKEKSNLTKTKNSEMGFYR